MDAVSLQVAMQTPSSLKILILKEEGCSHMNNINSAHLKT